MSDLATIQKWLTSIIIRPGTLRDKIPAADKTYNVNMEQIIASTALLSGYDRLQIYTRGYVLRLMECMRAEYPALRSLLGDELFDVFAQAYLIRKPSNSYSLFDLGDSFPEFLHASRPDQINATDEEKQKFDLPVELALLERAIAEVYRSKGTEGGAARDYSMFTLFESESVSASPCLRLLQLQFPLVDFVKAVERGEQPSVPHPRTTFAAVSRRNYIVQIQELEAWQWHFLKTLEYTSDQTLAVKAAAEASGIHEETMWADLMLWIPVALNRGYCEMV